MLSAAPTTSSPATVMPIIGDIPFIAKRFGAKILGSRTTVNLSLTAGVDSRIDDD